VLSSDRFVGSTDDVDVTSRSNLRKLTECLKCLILTQDRVQWRVSLFAANLPFLLLESYFILVSQHYLPQLDPNGMLALPKRVASASV